MSNDLHQRLRSLIGQRFEYLSQEWLLIEVLVDEDRLVLRRLHSQAPLQTDQYGQARNHGVETLSLPISDADDPDSYSEELLQLLPGKH